ncbi:cation diffusion facilitator family transporter [Methanopyrus kandleri]|uniref:Predicted Co/Zn/Cd cation transporter n=2 Tax=Methanopyrus kandleri TaxID=2320 RepID=Q8TV30_METKA|nr:cation diffusion facilitator family transporter [Methanopyrus kandleri]AAM02783.1 Predicted Co/Zn/Cd cation transporter [Methanopyrus kandleri AV19]HII71045.1 cation transporter [Methanopyrus kandleri]
MSGVEERLQEVRRGALIGIYGNILLSVLKIAIGHIASSWALVSDGVHSLGDTVSSVMVLLGAKVARKPPDARHMYGHYKAEALAGLGVSMMVTFTGLLLLWESLMRLRNPEPPTSTLPLVVALGTVAAKEGMYRYTLRLAERVGSSALKADAKHHRSDALSSVAASVGIAGALLGYPWADPGAALVVSLMIAHMGLELCWESVHELMDVAPEDELLERVHEIVENTLQDVDFDVELIAVRGRKMGPAYHFDVFVAADPEARLRELDTVRKRIVEGIRREISAAELVTVEFVPM